MPQKHHVKMHSMEQSHSASLSPTEVGSAGLPSCCGVVLLEHTRFHRLGLSQLNVLQYLALTALLPITCAGRKRLDKAS